MNIEINLWFTDLGTDGFETVLEPNYAQVIGTYGVYFEYFVLELVSSEFYQHLLQKDLV